MHHEKFSAPIRCFAIIAITAAAIAIIDLSVRAFFYAQAQRFTSYLPLLIGSIALCAMAINRRRNTIVDPTHQTHTTASRRVRVTGPIK